MAYSVGLFSSSLWVVSPIAAAIQPGSLSRGHSISTISIGRYLASSSKTDLVLSLLKLPMRYLQPYGMVEIMDSMNG